MDSKDTEIVALERKLLLVKLIQDHFLMMPDDNSVMFWDLELEPYGLMNDVGGLYRSLDKIHKELAPDFKHFITASRDGKIPIQIIRIDLENWKRLDKYIAEIEQEIRQLKKSINRYKFFLDSDGYLYLENSDQPPYEMIKGFLPYKILLFLASEKSYVTTQELVEEFRSNNKKIRTTVDQIRFNVSQKFDIPKDSIIESLPPLGYRITNVRL